MIYHRAKFFILWIFLFGLVSSLSMGFLIKAEDIMREDNINLFFKKIFSVYSVQLSVILATSFIDTVKDSTEISKPLYVSALLLSILWNLIILIRIFLFIYSDFTMGSDDAQYLLTFLEDIPSYASFLVAGVLAYFFSKKD